MFDLMPFRNNNSSLFNYLDNFEKNFFNDFHSNISQFRTDIIDNENHYLLQAELPGFNKEDIKIDLTDNLLTISAEHKEDKEEKKDNFIKKERKYGSFSRSFDVSGIDVEKITAEYKNGILELQLPKQEKPIPPNRQIDIK